MEAEQIRQDFPALRQKVNGERLVYLDNAATSQKPEQVIEAVADFYRNDNSNVGRSIHELGNRATKRYREARETVAGFIGADPDQTVFVRNTTHAMNVLARRMPVDGDIVLTEMAHHSEQLPWRRRAEQEGVEVRYIPTTDGNELDLDAARDIIDEDTSILSVSHVSNVFGCVNPVEELGALAEGADAEMVLDAAQSAPRMPLDVTELPVDAVCFSGHKLLGPAGTGVLWGREKLLERMQADDLGGGMVGTVSQDGFTTADPPEKFEAGTPDVASAVGLAEAVDYLQSIGMDNVASHESEVSSELVESLRDTEGVEVFAPGPRYQLSRSRWKACTPTTPRRFSIPMVSRSEPEATAPNHRWRRRVSSEQSGPRHISTTPPRTSNACRRRWRR